MDVQRLPVDARTRVLVLTGAGISAESGLATFRGAGGLWDGHPVEQVASLRAIPGLAVIRPADANETAAAWRWAIGRAEGPVALVLTRQKLPVLPGTQRMADEGVMRGAYVLAETDGGAPQAILLASGSEVQLALAAREQLAAEGIRARVVSMPCM